MNKLDKTYTDSYEDYCKKVCDNINSQQKSVDISEYHKIDGVVEQVKNNLLSR
jgi:hypothetical protein